METRSPSLCNNYWCFLYQLDGAKFLFLSPFCYNHQGFTEDRTGSITRCNHCPSLDHSDLVSPSSADVGGPSCSPPMLPSATDAANQPSLEAPPTQQVKVNGMQVVWDSLWARRVSEKAWTVILKSWRGSTQKQYQVYFQKWYCFCSKRGFDPCPNPPVKVLDFLAELFEQGLGHSTLNTARSALSQVLPPKAGVSFGDLPLVRQFMKGVLQEKPSLTRHTGIQPCC